MTRIFSPATLFLCVIAIGCSGTAQKATLIVHAHDGIFDFIDHDNVVRESVDNLDDFETVLEKDSIRKLIVDSRVIVRFAGVKTANGMSMPDELVPAMAKLAGAGVMRQDFDYTNDCECRE